MGNLIFHAGPQGKANRANAKGMTRHTQRKTKGTGNHSNEDIDKDLTEYNIDLTVNGKTADEVIEDRLENEYKGKRKLRKDHVVLREIITQPSPDMFDGMSIEEKQKMMDDFLKDAVPWFAKEFGGENIVGASAHLDETNPHAHIMVMPMIDGRVSQTEFFKGPRGLSRQHKEYRQHMIDKGWDFDIENKYEDIDSHDTPVFKKNAKKIQEARKKQTNELRTLTESPDVRQEALNAVYSDIHGKILKDEREKLDERERRLEAKGRAAETKLDDLYNREGLLDQREAKLDEREKWNEKRDGWLTESEAALGKKEMELYDKASDLAGREARIGKQAVQALERNKLSNGIVRAVLVNDPKRQKGYAQIVENGVESYPPEKVTEVVVKSISEIHKRKPEHRSVDGGYVNRVIAESDAPEDDGPEV